MMRKKMLNIALEIARKTHYTLATPTAIAAALGCSRGLVYHYLGRRDERVRAVLQHAVNVVDRIVILQGVRNGDIIQ